MEDVRRILREVLETEHDDHYVSGSDDPETGRRCRIHDRDHEEGCCQEEQHEFCDHERCNGNTDMYPRIDQRADTESQLPKSFYIEYFRHEVEEHVDRTKAVLDEVTGLYLESQVPVVVEEALDRCQRDQREAVQEQHVVVVPSVDGRKVFEQDQERYEAAQVRHDHTDGGDHEVGTVTHLALQVLDEYLSVYSDVEAEASSRLWFCHSCITHNSASVNSNLADGMIPEKDPGHGQDDAPGQLQTEHRKQFLECIRAVFLKKDRQRDVVDGAEW